MLLFCGGSRYFVWFFCVFMYLLPYLFAKAHAMFVCILFGKKVGEDQYKNKYYVLAFKNYLGKHKRFCLFYGLPEATKVPPNWADWMAHRTNFAPSSSYTPKYSWIMPSLPMLTLSKYKYRQLKHSKYNSVFDVIPRLNLQNKTGVRSYKAWSPN